MSEDLKNDLFKTSLEETNKLQCLESLLVEGHRT